MTTSNNNFADTTIVAFHIGRGGHFNNQGFKRFIGEEKIGKYTEQLFSRHENLCDFKNRFGFDNTYHADHKCIIDLATDEQYEDLEELFGITREMLGEIIWFNGNGNPVGLTEAERLTGVGCIDEDGDYDTTYTCYLVDCDDDELQIIADYHGYVDSNIVSYAKEKLGITDEIEEEDEY